MLLEKGFSEEYGARPIKRVITRYIEDALSEAMLKGDVTEGDVLEAYIIDEEVHFKPI